MISDFSIENISLRLLILNVVTALSLHMPAFAAEDALAEGIAAYNKGSYREALGLFNLAKSKHFDDPVLHYYMANACMKLNFRDDAIKEYKLALTLDPKSKVASYCESALRSLEGGAPPAAKTSFSKAPLNAKSDPNVKNPAPPAPNTVSSGAKQPVKIQMQQTPQVIGFLCGCPMCHRVELIITDLHSKHGDKIDFVRTMINAKDEKGRALVAKYSISKCPSVLVIGFDGQPAHEFSGFIPERNLRDDVDKLAKAAVGTNLPNTSNKQLSEMRKMVVDEVEARISHDEIRVNQEIKKVQTLADGELASLTGRSDERSAQRELIENDRERKIQSIKDDFERRKKDWYKAAQERIKALESTASFSK